MRYVEPGWLSTRHRTLQLRTSKQFEQPIRLAHLSDFHLSDVVPLAMINKAIEGVVEQAPDLICLTGDYVTSKIEPHHEYVRTLQKLSATTPTVAVLGNHDGGAWARINRGYSDTRKIEGILRLAGITCLKNQNMTVQVKGQELELVGLCTRKGSRVRVRLEMLGGTLHSCHEWRRKSARASPELSA